MTEPCPRCDGTGWVCENHHNRPWDGASERADACGCGAGDPCPDCQPAAGQPRVVDDEAVRVELDVRGEVPGGVAYEGAAARGGPEVGVRLPGRLDGQVGHGHPRHQERVLAGLPVQGVPEHGHGVGERAQAEVAVEGAVQVGRGRPSAVQCPPVERRRSSSRTR